MLSLFYSKSKNHNSSKIVPETRFQSAPPNIKKTDYTSGLYTSNISFLQKVPKKTHEVKPHIWLSKSPKNADQIKGKELFCTTLDAQCEVFSAWQYEAFIGQSNTQPKYYLVQHANNTVSVTTKHITSYKSVKQFSTPDEFKTAFSDVNLKLFAQMLVNYMWLAGSDFKRDHIGLDGNKNLVCLDFGKTMIPFLSPSTYSAYGWNFSITSDDLSNAPFFKTYQSSNYFINSLTQAFGLFNRNEKFKTEFYTAVLKKCIFPDYITFAGLELFDNDILQNEVKTFIHERTIALRDAALNNKEWCAFVLHRGDEFFPDIQIEILRGDLNKTRYFRKKADEFKIISQEQLNFNYRDLRSSILFQVFRQQSPFASDALRFLRTFCSDQFQAQRMIADTSNFNRGAKDKRTFYSNVLDKIDRTDFLTITDPTDLQTFILNLTREIAIIAHHKRYSMIDMLCGIKNAAGWVVLGNILQRLEDKNAFKTDIRSILNTQSERVLTLGSETISTYNEYRHFTYRALTKPETKKYDTVVKENKVTLYLNQNRSTDADSGLGQKRIVMQAVHDYMNGHVTWFHVCKLMTINRGWDEGFFSRVKNTIHDIRQGNAAIANEERLHQDFTNIVNHLHILESTPGASLSEHKEKWARQILLIIDGQLNCKNPDWFDHGAVRQRLSLLKSTPIGQSLESLYLHVKNHVESNKLITAPSLHNNRS